MVDAVATLDPPISRTGAPPADHGKIADIELLRGVAILFVLVEHTWFNLVIWGSPLLMFSHTYLGLWTGVDLFFGISGFVIARSLLPVLESCVTRQQFWQAAIAFWIRRGWRLLPSAWLWLAVLLLASIFFNESEAFRSVPQNVETTVAAVLNVANIQVAETLGHGLPGAAFPYWSLSLEEQFYLLLPIAAFVTGRRLPLLLGALVLVQLLIPRMSSAVLQNLRTEALLMGVLIALWSRHATYRLCEPTGLARSRLARFAILALPLWIIAGMGSHILNIIPLRASVISLLVALLVLIASYDRDYLMRDGTLKRILLWFGSRSYALYLTHIPAFFLTREVWFRATGADPAHGGDFALPYVVSAYCLLACFAELNYRFVETPLRRKGAGIAARFAARPA